MAESKQAPHFEDDDGSDESSSTTSSGSFDDDIGDEEGAGGRGQPRRDNEEDDDEDDDDDDSDFDASFADSVDNQRRGAAAMGKDAGADKGASLQVREVENQPYDAHVDLDESFSDESIDTGDTGTPKMRDISGLGKAAGVSLRSGADAAGDEEDDDRDSKLGDSPPNTLSSPGLGNHGLSDDEEIPGAAGKESKSADAHNKRANVGVKLEAGDASMRDAAQRAAEQSKAIAATRKSAEEDNDDDDDDDEDDDESSMTNSTGNRRGGSGFEGFDPREFDHLDVSNEVKELFQYIVRYKPHDIELDTKLRCFIPDYIPAVGDIDAFVKIPRPDREPDDLGLKVLDEPAATQSDATVLDLQLRAMSKKSVKNPMIVRSIENADKDPKAVQNWIDSIKDLHRSKPPPQVHYTKQMPDIESLMQVWPEQVEQLMKEIKMPSADIDLDLKDYARVVCAILDIPVFNNMIEPLHVLFTLYAEFRDNHHFQNADAQPQDEY